MEHLLLLALPLWYWNVPKMHPCHPRIYALLTMGVKTLNFSLGFNIISPYMDGVTHKKISPSVIFKIGNWCFFQHHAMSSYSLSQIKFHHLNGYNSTNILKNSFWLVFRNEFLTFKFFLPFWPFDDLNLNIWPCNSGRHFFGVRCT